MVVYIISCIYYIKFVGFLYLNLDKLDNNLICYKFDDIIIELFLLIMKYFFH